MSILLCSILWCRSDVMGQLRRFGHSGPMSDITPITTKLATHHDGRKGPIGDKVHRSKKSAYSITSSARSSSADSIVKPSVLAVFRLMTSSILVGTTIGRSPDGVLLRIVAT